MTKKLEEALKNGEVMITVNCLRVGDKDVYAKVIPAKFGYEATIIRHSDNLKDLLTEMVAEGFYKPASV